MKEKVVICTLYDSVNCGTYLQAYSLMRKVEELGYEVYFLKLKNNNSKITNSHKNLNLKNLVIKVFRKIKLLLVFKNSSSVFKTIDLDQVNSDDSIRNIIIGSDELWNVKNNSFTHFKEYFGFNFVGKNVISYAPSANDSTKDDILNKFSDINFDNFNFLSARDYKTKKLLNDFGRNDVFDVVDPTMLLNDFDSIIEKTNLKKYIVVYGHSFTDNQIQCIKKFASEKHLSLVSITRYFDWCDMNIVATPGKFLYYLKNADYVITSTFHGSVFSILFEKKFAVYLNNGSKIKDLLSKFNLESRIVDDNISSVFGQDIDYDEVKKILETYRESSICFLKKALKGSDFNE